jgi:hypothetical protein
MVCFNLIFATYGRYSEGVCLHFLCRWNLRISLYGVKKKKTRIFPIITVKWSLVQPKLASAPVNETTYFSYLHQLKIKVNALAHACIIASVMPSL